MISSPNAPDTYPPNSVCRWVIDVPTNYVIQLTWHSFVLEEEYECEYDYVTMYDNATVAGTGGIMGKLVFIQI